MRIRTHILALHVAQPKDRFPPIRDGQTDVFDRRRDRCESTQTGLSRLASLYVIVPRAREA
jgi:hypothetical protein